jgi:hypothetical protein
VDRCPRCRIPAGLHRLTCALRIVCPRCDELPENPCRRPDGQTNDLPHIDRIERARRAADALWHTGQVS